MDDFPADLKHFVMDNVKSVAQLEALLTLQENPTKLWTATEVAQTLYISAEAVALQLAELCERGLLEVETSDSPQYRFRPRSEELDKLAGRLAGMYKERRVSVITLIYSQPVDKVRTLADAFRLRREP